MFDPKTNPWRQLSSEEIKEIIRRNSNPTPEEIAQQEKIRELVHGMVLKKMEENEIIFYSECVKKLEELGCGIRELSERGFVRAVYPDGRWKLHDGTRACYPD